jgi:CRP-like cAMP-binding protein
MALLESAAAAAAAPAADAEGGSGAGADTKATRSSGRADNIAGGSGWSAFRWPKRSAGAADAGNPHGTRGASVRALTAVSVAVVPAARFHAVCAAHPEVRQYVWYMS